MALNDGTLEDYVFVNVEPGHYLILEGDTVVAEVRRTFKHGTYYPEYDYTLKWRSTGVIEKFLALHEIHTMYHFKNYPGYMAVLRTPQDKTSYKRRWKQR